MRLLKQMQYDETKVNEATGESVTKHYVQDYGAYMSILRELEGC